jgi:hypothetical protein
MQTHTYFPFLTLKKLSTEIKAIEVAKRKKIQNGVLSKFTIIIRGKTDKTDRFTGRRILDLNFFSKKSSS